MPARDAPATAEVPARAGSGPGVGSAALWVLDTNALLDWVVFDDPAMRGLAAAIVAGHARWICTEAMLAEAEDVLARPAFVRFGGADALLPRLALIRRDHAMVLPEPPPCGLRCADPDDQVFIDLALARRAELLLTRDRALLDLAAGAAASGLRIATPAGWAAAAADALRRATGAAPRR